MGAAGGGRGTGLEQFVDCREGLMQSRGWIALLAVVLAVGVVVLWAEARPAAPKAGDWVVQKIPGNGLVYIELVGESKFMKRSEVLTIHG